MDHSSQRKRLTVLFVCFVLAAVSLGLRAAWLQITPQPRLAQLAKRQFQSQIWITPKRGLILDRLGETLAGSLDSNSLAANPSKLTRRKQLAKLLAQALDLPFSRVLERLIEKREFVWIKRQLSEGDVAALKRFGLMKGSAELHAGLFLVRESKRMYPHGRLAAHVLGHVNIDSEGLEGVELWQEKKLRGKSATLASSKDARGRPAFVDTAAANQAQDGQNVELTIDAPLQFVVEEHLAQAVAKYHARSGSALVMDATTGAILAMANEPSFDPNDKNSAPERRRNRLLTDGYEPGSTVKPLFVAEALARGGKITDRVWGEHGHFRIQGKRITEAEAHEKFEWIDLAKILQLSSNVGAAKVALKLGKETAIEMLRRVGFGARTGLGIPGEIPGALPDPKSCQPLRLANMGFGQGLFVTPLQVARAFATLANGGWLVNPQLLKNEAGMPPKRVWTDQVAREVTQALEGVTRGGGTGVRASVPGFRIAGKTGTSQFAEVGTRGYARGKYIASFVGYPVGTLVRPVVYVSLHEPKGVYYAAQTAAPLFQVIMTATLQRLGVQPTEKPEGEAAPVLAQTPRVDVVRVSQSAPIQSESVTLNWVPGGFQADGRMTWQIPNWRGLTTRQVLASLKGKNFDLRFGREASHQNMEGTVLRQYPEAGKNLAEGGEIRLVIAE